MSSTRSLCATAAMLTALSCSGGGDIQGPSTGSLQITTATSGEQQDADGYHVALNSGSGQVIGLNATLTIANLTSGTHEVRLSGLAANCLVEGDNPRLIEISAGGVAVLTFSIVCSAQGLPRIVFVRSSATGSPADFYVMNADGSGATRLNTQPVSLTGDFVWSPDGRKAAFGGGDVFVINADGTGLTNLTNQQPGHNLEPAWSPDGKRIAFASYHREGCCSDIWVMNADGSSPIDITNDVAADFERSPVWSPNGKRIAFRREAGSDLAPVYVINADGTGNGIGMPGSGYDGYPPAVWSPDGSRIAYEAVDNDPSADVSSSVIYVADADGTRPIRLTGAACQLDEICGNTEPAWSPDGRKIAFVSGVDGNDEIYIATSDGSGTAERLTVDIEAPRSPKWSPEGSKIAFVGSRDGNAEIYVMNPDGSGQTNLTNNPAADGAFAWVP